MKGVSVEISEVVVTLSPDHGDRVSVDRLLSAIYAIPALLAAHSPIDPSRWQVMGELEDAGDGKLSFPVRPIAKVEGDGN